MSRPLPPRQSAPALTDITWGFLFDQAPAADCGFEDDFEYWMLQADRANLTTLGLTQAELWARYGEGVLRWWRRENPGTRPSLWWKFRAPEPRLRLGGMGEPSNRDMWLGVPSYWWRPIRGDLQGARELSFDSDDPPLYESEPGYLRRFALLEPAEVRQLKPADFAPIPITEIFSISATNDR